MSSEDSASPSNS